MISVASDTERPEKWEKCFRFECGNGNIDHFDTVLKEYRKIILCEGYDEVIGSVSHEFYKEYYPKYFNVQNLLVPAAEEMSIH